ncbi:MAG TPA: hypothetical protein VJM11_11740, partial [Nevskiaceae bacterium]|nr:hypothetical protein [Nevskiaceae bacterium]
MPVAARKDATEAELEALKARIEEIDRELAESQGERDSLQVELEKSERAIAAAAAASREASADL